ncbi:MAG: hypothetical protein II809_01675, partial [Bacteroidales bacterium]|nr:hypothetical protein [Bacteroidales bacterium]
GQLFCVSGPAKSVPGPDWQLSRVIRPAKSVPGPDLAVSTLHLARKGRSRAGRLAATATGGAGTV